MSEFHWLALDYCPCGTDRRGCNRPHIDLAGEGASPPASRELVDTVLTVSIQSIKMSASSLPNPAPTFVRERDLGFLHPLLDCLFWFCFSLSECTLVALFKI